MNISWLGYNCFRVSEKIDGQEVIVVTDPFSKQIGFFPPKLKTDIVTVSFNSEQYNFVEKIDGNIDEKPIVFDRPGEYETKKVSLQGIQTGKIGEENVIFKFEMDSIKVAHLGALKEKLTEDQLDELGEVDILLVPIGANNVLDGEKAAAVVRQIEPRLIIPMHYHVKGLSVKADDEVKFLKEMGGNAQKESKLKIARKDLPEDQTIVVILEKS